MENSRTFKIVMLGILCLMMPVCAQAQGVNIRGQVNTLQVGKNCVIVSAEGFGAKRDEALEDAQKEAVSKLLYEGLPGFNGGRHLAENQQNHWLRRFFEGRGAPYLNYIGGVMVEDEIVKTPKGEYYCRAIVKINYPSMVRSFKGQNILPKNYQIIYE